MQWHDTFGIDEVRTVCQIVYNQSDDEDDKRGSATGTREVQLRSDGAHVLLGWRFEENGAATRARCVAFIRSQMHAHIHVLRSP